MLSKWDLRPNSLQGKEFEIVFLIEPGTLEDFHGKPGASRERQRVDDQLIQRIDCCCIGLVVEKVNEAISYLHHVDMPNDRLGELR